MSVDKYLSIFSHQMEVLYHGMKCLHCILVLVLSNINKPSSLVSPRNEFGPFCA